MNASLFFMRQIWHRNADVALKIYKNWFYLKVKGNAGNARVWRGAA